MEMNKLNELMAELLDGNVKREATEFTVRGYEIINEISDYAEQTKIFIENKECGKMFDDDDTAQQVFVYMLDRIVNAPTTLHRNCSVILLMPIVRQKLREKGKM